MSGTWGKDEDVDIIRSGSSLPALPGKLIFGDITTRWLWYGELSNVFAADDGDAGTDSRDGVESPHAHGGIYPARGGEGETLPGGGAASGRGLVDLRIVGGR